MENGEKTKSGMRTLAATAAMAIVFFCLNSAQIIQAQPAGTGTGAPAGAVQAPYAEASCTTDMGNFGQYQFGQFQDFLRTNFQNKSSTTSLLDAAFGRYKELRTALYNKYYTYYPQQGASQLTEGIGTNACMSAMNSVLSQAKHELEARAIQTSTVKKATALITKYQQINAELGTLNRTFITMKSYLDTFAAKLPCYIAKSCNKG